MLQFPRSRRRLLTWFILVLLLITATDALATGPQSDPGLLAFHPQIHYQARLVDPASGVPKPDGTYSVQFAIYDVETRGSPLWSETQSLRVGDGMMSAMLGSVTPLNPSILQGSERWLGVTVGQDLEMTPRQPIAYVPYAIYAYAASTADQATTADDCDTVDGKHAKHFAASVHSHDYEPIAFGYVNRDGVAISGTGNFSVTWNEVIGSYVIRIDDHYYAEDSVCQLTLSDSATDTPGGTSIREDTAMGNLFVSIIKSDGTATQSPFNFIIWPSPRY